MAEEQQLIRMAIEARKKSYSPYSHFKVGTCLETWGGKFYTGCNIENAGYTATNCAERTAFFRAVSEGEYNFRRIAIVGGGEKGITGICPPCGVCLQVMMEFCNRDVFQVILAKSPEEYEVVLLKELLPKGFGPGQLKK